MLQPLRIDQSDKPSAALQDHISRLLQKRTQGAILIHGDARANLSLAHYFALYAFCRGSPAPCGTCPPCSLLRSGSHPDAWHLLPEERKIKIDDTRALNQHMSRKGMQGSRKLVCIERLDLATREASNALLKLLEEPPVDSWLLCTAPHPDSILPTLSSRLLPVAAVLDWPSAWAAKGLDTLTLHPQAEPAFEESGLTLAADLLGRLNLQQKPRLDALQKSVRQRGLSTEMLAVHIEAIAYTLCHLPELAAIEKNRSNPYNISHLNGLDLSIRAAISAILADCADAIRSNCNVALVLENWLLDARRIMRSANT